MDRQVDSPGLVILPLQNCFDKLSWTDPSCLFYLHSLVQQMGLLCLRQSSMQFVMWTRSPSPSARSQIQIVFLFFFCLSLLHSFYFKCRYFLLCTPLALSCVNFWFFLPLSLSLLFNLPKAASAANSQIFNLLFYGSLMRRNKQIPFQLCIPHSSAGVGKLQHRLLPPMQLCCCICKDWTQAKHRNHSYTSAGITRERDAGEGCRMVMEADRYNRVRKSTYLPKYTEEPHTQKEMSPSLELSLSQLRLALALAKMHLEKASRNGQGAVLG